MVGDIREILCWRGPASVNVFVLGTGDTPLPRAAFHLAGLVPDAVLPFPLMEPPEAIARLGLISYDLDFEDVSVDFRAFTRAALRRVCESTPAVAWAALEGTFSYEELLTDQVARQVYGYCVSGPRPTPHDRGLGHRPLPSAPGRHPPQCPGPGTLRLRRKGPGTGASGVDGRRSGHHRVNSGKKFGTSVARPLRKAVR